jgi:hypothetical protein
VSNDGLGEYVRERLAGTVCRLDGTIVTGPQTPACKGLNKPHRQDRRWATAWSAQQIAHRLCVEFPDDESMRISHEAIYQSLFIEGRGALKRELVACLRTGRALRVPRRGRRTSRKDMSPRMSSSANAPPKPPIARSRDTGRGI